MRLTQARGTDRAAALALWGTVIPIGLAVGGAAGGTLAQAIGWRGWLGLTGALPLLAATAVAAAIPPDPAAAPPASSPRSRLGRDGFGGPVLLAGGFCGVCLMGIAVLSLLPTFLVDQRGVSLGTAGLATGMVALATSRAAWWRAGCCAAAQGRAC